MRPAGRMHIHKRTDLQVTASGHGLRVACRFHIRQEKTDYIAIKNCLEISKSSVNQITKNGIRIRTCDLRVAYTSQANIPSGYGATTRPTGRLKVPTCQIYAYVCTTRRPPVPPHIMRMFVRPTGRTICHIFTKSP